MLTGIDVASRYKVATALRSTKTCKVAFVLQALYKRMVCLNTQIFKSYLKNTTLTFDK